MQGPSQEGLQLVGRFLALVLRQAPGADQLEQLLPLLGELPVELSNAELQGGAALLADYARAAAGAGGDLPAAAEALRQDFVALFEGPGAMGAPPWESVYRTEEQVLFGPTTVQVRQAYQRWGLGLKHPGREPEDHIALELEFMLFLTDRMAGEPEAAAERERFLREHLQVWVPPFVSLLEDGAATAFYQGVAKVLLGYITALD